MTWTNGTETLQSIIILDSLDIYNETNGTIRLYYNNRKEDIKNFEAKVKIIMPEEEDGYLAVYVKGQLNQNDTGVNSLPYNFILEYKDGEFNGAYALYSETPEKPFYVWMFWPKNAQEEIKFIDLFFTKKDKLYSELCTNAHFKEYLKNSK
jgi:hypothetical protein